MPNSATDELQELPDNAPIYPYLIIGALAILAGFYLLFIPAAPQAPEGTQQTHITKIPPVSLPPSAQSQEPIFAFVDTLESSYGQVAKELQTKLKNKGIALTVAPQFQLQGETIGELQMINMLREGQIHMAFITTSPLSNVLPELALLDLPYLFDSYQHIDAFYQSPQALELASPLKESNLVPLGYAEVGRRIISSSVPITGLKTLADKRIRILQSTAYQEAYKLWNVIPVPARVDKIAELSKANLIDGADRTYPTYWDFELYKAHKYVLESYHTYTCKLLLVNRDWFQSLTPTQQQALARLGKQACREQIRLQRLASEQVQERIAQRDDLILHLLSQESKNKLREASQPLYDSYHRQFAQDWVAIIESFQEDTNPRERGEHEE